jgi:integrase/recombinase XerD
VHHKLEELLDEYLKATGLGNEPGSLLFPAALGKTGKLSRRPLVCTDAADMLKQAGSPAHYSPHSFRVTGITNFLENDGTLEAAQRIASHADSRTTKPTIGVRRRNGNLSELRSSVSLVEGSSKSTS